MPYIVYFYLKGNFVLEKSIIWLLFFILATVYLFHSGTLKFQRHINTYPSSYRVPELKRDISSDKIFTTLAVKIRKGSHF